MGRSVEVGYPRGEETRARILRVAIDLFGTKGFDSVSTREVAAASSVPPASLRYYFENKQGLYVACLEHVRMHLFELVEPALEAAEVMLADEDAPIDRLIESYCQLQDARVESFLGGPDGGVAALFSIRHDLPSQSGSYNPDSSQISIRRLTACYVGMMIRISGNTLDPTSAIIVTGMINGELVNICLRRYRLEQMGWSVTPERVEWMKRAVRQHTRVILDSYRT